MFVVSWIEFFWGLIFISSVTLLADLPDWRGGAAGEHIWYGMAWGMAAAAVMSAAWLWIERDNFSTG